MRAVNRAKMPTERRNESVKNSEPIDGRSKLAALLAGSEIAGLKELHETTSLIGKLVWLLVILASFAGLTFELYSAAVEYFNHPIVTKFDLVSPEDGLEFPQIYICPPSAVHRTRWEAKIVDVEWEEEHVKGLLKAHADNLSHLMAAKTTLSEYLQKVTEGYTIESMPESSTPKIWRPSNVAEYFMEVGYPTGILFRECAFDSQQLDCDTIVTPYFDGDMGKCFLIQLDRNQTRAGMGLSLLIDLDVANAYPTGADHPLFDGVTLKISKNFDPFSTTKTLLDVSKYTLVNIEARELSKERTSVQACAKKGDEKLAVLETNYSRWACLADCAQKIVMDQCKCLLPVDHRLVQEPFKSLSICKPESLRNCSYPALENLSKDRECRRMCPVPCRDWDYRIQLSSATFPSKNLKAQDEKITQQNYGDISKEPQHPPDLGFDSNWGASTNNAIPPPDDKIMPTLLQKPDLLLVDIAFGALEKVEIKQRDSMSLTTFISNVGGQLGLWVGWSIVAILKFPILIISLLCYCCKLSDGASNA